MPTTAPQRNMNRLHPWRWLAMLVLGLVLLPGLALPTTAMAQAATDVPAADATHPLVPAEDADVVERLDFAFGNAKSKLMQLLTATPLLLAAILVVVLFSWAGAFVSRRLHWLRLRTRNPYLDGMIRGAVRVVIVLSGVVIALDMLGATPLVGAVLGSAGLVGLVVGFAFKDIAENYIAGVLLSLRRPFSPSDHVRIDSHEGKVVALTTRATMLMTLDGNELRLPNSLVFKAVILNYSRNPRRRFEFTVVIDAAQSIRSAQTLAMQRIGAVAGVLGDPGPSWTVVEFAPSGITLRFFGWLDRNDSDPGKVRSEAIRQVKAAFTSAGIEGPRTLYHLQMQEAATPRANAEPGNGTHADTSVNTDIDQQVADAQQAGHYQDLLQPEHNQQP